MSETKPGITVYGAYWCPDCRRSKQFLGEHQIPYHWVDIDQDPTGEQHVLEKNQGKRIIPTIEFSDGSILVEPSNAALARKLGLKMTAAHHHYELIVVGGGPAGLTAALYTAREGISTLIVERAAIGGQTALTERLENVPGFADGIEGATFASNLRRQAARFGVEMLQAQEVSHLHSHDNYQCITTTDGSEYSGNTLLLATGSRYKRLGVPGEEEYIGAGIHFCATCDGPFYKGQHVAVIGGGNSAAEESLFLVKFAEKVTILARSDKLKASKVIQENLLANPKVEVRYNTVVTSIRGERGRLKKISLLDPTTGKTEEMSPAGIFIFIGQAPNSAFLAGSGVVTDAWGFVLTGHDLIHSGADLSRFGERKPDLLETSMPGIFAAGDLRSGSTKQVASATGEGAAAALLVREYLKKQSV